MGWLPENLTQRGMSQTGAAFQVAIIIVVGIPPAALVSSLLGRVRRPALATTSLSAFTPCVGYVVAAVGPVAFGALYEIVDSWTAPLLTLAAVAAAQAVLGTLTVRAGYVEDELRPTARTSDGAGVGVGVLAPPDDDPGQCRDRHATEHSE
jgi:cyanate permease